MADERPFARDIGARQIAMFAMFVGPGRYTTRAALSSASGYPVSSLREWAGGATLPFHVVLGLRRHLPAAAIDMLAEVGGVRLVDAERADSDWLSLAGLAAGLTSEICAALGDGRVDHREDATLRQRTRELVARAGSMTEAE